MLTASYVGFGSAIAALGIGMVILHVRTHRLRQSDEELSDNDLRFYRKQYARRMQTSALLVTLGALIGLCGYMENMKDSPVFASIYVLALLGLPVWLIFLALSDVVATRVYLSRIDRTSRDVNKSLQQALAEVRKAHGIDPS